MKNSEFVFDTIVYKTGEVRHGIIDYASAKHFYFFDFTEINDMAYSLLAIAWRADYLEAPKRFSVYCLINYPMVRLPQAKLIPKASLDDASITIKYKSKKSEQKKSRVNYQS